MIPGSMGSRLSVQPPARPYLPPSIRRRRLCAFFMPRLTRVCKNLGLISRIQVLPIKQVSTSLPAGGRSPLTLNTGIRVPSLLVNPSAAIAAISNVTNTMVYYYDRTNSVLTVRELTFSGIPGSSTNKETFNNPATAPIVTQPALMTSSKQWSVYQPLGAGISTTPGPTNQAISIFWAEGVVTSESGYSALKVATRNPGQPWNPTNGVALNLGTSSDAPHGLLA